MSNDRLRKAISVAGFTMQRLAEQLEVDPKTVERWVTRDVTPQRATAHKAARVLNVNIGYLWPQLDDHRGQATEEEVVAFYPHRSSTPKALWFDLLGGAQREITLMAYASLFLPEDNPASIRLLKDKAAAGVQVRICLGDPDTPQIELRGREERLHEGLVGRVRMAIAYYRPLLGVPGVEFRLHTTTLYNSIFVYDDEMLLNQHAYGVYGFRAPILHLRRCPGGDLFDMYYESLQRVWEEAYPYAPAGESGDERLPGTEDRSGQDLRVA